MTDDLLQYTCIKPSATGGNAQQNEVEQILQRYL